MEVDNEKSPDFLHKDSKIELKILLLSDIHIPTDNITLLK
jgi:hypothetical protein